MGAGGVFESDELESTVFDTALPMEVESGFPNTDVALIRAGAGAVL
jgi:hypothetical protein